MAVAAFALTTGNAHAHGTERVIAQEAKRLGIAKDPTELTPSDIDRLSNKQANGLAQVERELWGCEQCVLGLIKAKDSRQFLKEASVIFARP